MLDSRYPVTQPIVTDAFEAALTVGETGLSSADNTGTATAGKDGVLILHYWNGSRYLPVVGLVGDVRLYAFLAYRLNDKKKFVEVPGA